MEIGEGGKTNPGWEVSSVLCFSFVHYLFQFGVGHVYVPAQLVIASTITVCSVIPGVLHSFPSLLP